jgi:hypothetical protein
MKKIGIVLLISALSMTGCKKESTTLKDTTESYSLSDFMDTRVTENTASRSNTISPKSNLKAIIRKVANTTDKYRLVLKVDSIEIENKDPKTGEIKLQMVDIESVTGLILTAGLSIPDPINPDKESVLFTKESMQFTKQNENGFFVYVSTPFGGPSGTADEPNGFAYELVKLSYSLIGKWTFDDGHGLDSRVIEVNDIHSCFILPSGKAIEQNPTVEKVNAQGKWIHANGQEFVEYLIITIGNDPAQEIEKIIFVPEAMKIETGDPKNPYKIVQLPSVDFDKTVFNQNTGISKFRNKMNFWSVYNAREYSWSGFTPLNRGAFYSVSGTGGKVTKIVVSSGGLGYNAF